MSEAEAEPIIVDTIEQLEGYVREAIAAGAVGDVLCLMEVAKEGFGEAEADRVYEEIIRPGLGARWFDWAVEDGVEPPDLTEDELKMIKQMMIERFESDPAYADRVCQMWDELEEGSPS